MTRRAAAIRAHITDQGPRSVMVTFMAAKELPHRKVAAMMAA
jgi:hypothetical protein